VLGVLLAVGHGLPLDAVLCERIPVAKSHALGADVLPVKQVTIIEFQWSVYSDRDRLGHLGKRATEYVSGHPLGRYDTAGGPTKAVFCSAAGAL
jgi:hypothetical protein